MTTSTTKRGLSWIAGALFATGLAGAAAVLLPSASWSNDSREVPEGIARVPVVRADLAVTVIANGELNSAENTLIECQLEEFSERSAGGQRISTSGRSVIIDLIPEGSVVERGEVLCQIDGSEYEELIRQKVIEVEKVRAQLQQAELDLQTARIELTEFADGTRVQRIQEYEGQVKLAESQYQRQLDRMEWSEKMLPLGYISQSRHEQEKQLLLGDRIALDRVREAYASYERYTVPKIVQTLETQVDQRLSTATYMRRRFEREEEMLVRYQKQFENCTIRAPHAGYVIYAEDRRRSEQIAPGVAVRQRMNLFYLPNLDAMQVEVGLNETVVERVEAGMIATIRVPAFPEKRYRGRVVKVEQLPLANRDYYIKDDVKTYRAIVAMESAPGLMPKMDAEVEIVIDERPGVLVVPAEALAFERGSSFCYVTGAAGLERRTVDVRPGTIEMLQVTGGLDEGEQVVLNPMRYELDGLVVDRPDAPIVTRDPSDAGDAQAAAGSAPLLQ